MMGLFKKYKVEYFTDKAVFDGAKDAYRPGAAVEFCFSLIATDTSYTFFVDGEAFDPDYEDGRGFVIRFTMPAHDVTVEVRSRNLMAEENLPVEQRGR